MKNIPFVNLSKQWETERKYLLKIIDKTLLSGLWIGGNEVEENKPSGEIYKKAIETLGTDKNIIIEDSPTGIRSGKDLGNFVIAIDRGMFTNDQLSEADLVVDKLNPEEIKTLFKTL